MNPRRSPPVPAAGPLFAVAALAFSLGGCFGPDLTPGAESVVSAPADSPERAAARAEIRQRAEATEEMPYPDAFQAEQTARLGARGEPRTDAEVAEIQAELAAIALLQQSAATPEEIAELDARAAALREAALAKQARR